LAQYSSTKVTVGAGARAVPIRPSLLVSDGVRYSVVYDQSDRRGIHGIIPNYEKKLFMLPEDEKRRLVLLWVALIIGGIFVFILGAGSSDIFGPGLLAQTVPILFAGILTLLIGLYIVRFRKDLSVELTQNLQQNKLDRLFFFSGKYHPLTLLVSGIIFVLFGITAIFTAIWRFFSL
jgi:hypothetical protein